MEKIIQYTLKGSFCQTVIMPSDSRIIDIQIDNLGVLTMWAICDTSTEEIEVKINKYASGYVFKDNNVKDVYIATVIATVQENRIAWHFFMNHEI